MTAAVKVETLIGGMGNILSTSGKALKVASYTVTTTTASDWIVASDFSTVTNVFCELISTGVLNAGVISASNTVTLTGTAGAQRVILLGY